MDGPDEVRIGAAAVGRDGGDVALVAAAGSVHDGLAMEEALEQDGIPVEAVDLRTLRAFDFGTVLASIRKTVHGAAVDERLIAGGWAEVLARATEQPLGYLDGACRITSSDPPTTRSPPPEGAFLSGVDRIAAETRRRLR